VLPVGEVVAPDVGAVVIDVGLSRTSRVSGSRKSRCAPAVEELCSVPAAGTVAAKPRGPKRVLYMIVSL
jgi:hypothetical protein